MKKLIIILALLVAGMAASAQVTWTQATVTVNTSAAGEVWGTGTHDTTLTSLITTQYIFVLRGAKPFDIQFQTLLTKVSGDVTGTYIQYLGSNDGVTYVHVDSTALAADASLAKWKNLDDFNYSYLKVVGIGAGTAGKCKLGGRYSIRQE